MMGTCRVCGCIQEQACYGGCRWINNEQDLCTACVVQFVVVDAVNDLSPRIIIDARLGTIPAQLNSIIENNIVWDFTGASIDWGMVWEEYFLDAT